MNSTSAKVIVAIESMKHNISLLFLMEREKFFALN
jgi:hypothetical protein